MAEKGGVLRNLKNGEGRLSGPSGTYDVSMEGQTPCSMACPAGVDIKAYVNLVADRRYEDAVQTIRRANPFPGICGRVCTHPCEAECGRRDIDQAVSIKALKRFASDYELSRKEPVTPAERSRTEKIAIVGSGPAGLTAASDLALAGFRVTVFDAYHEPGGLLAWGIPDFRLPKNIVRSEIRGIAALGVEIVTGKKVEMPAELLKKGYSAVILAMGCQVPMQARIPGEDAALDCLDFLRKVSAGDAVKLGKRVVVIGGGNAALDSARTALRLGADVTVAYRRTEAEMPADPDEIGHAKEEGVKFEFLAIPSELVPEKLVRFQRARLGEPDESGRRSPVPIPGDYFDIKAESAIMAIGSKPDVSRLPRKLGLAKGGAPETDDDGMTTVPGIFAAGDLATGPSTIVDAIGGGHRAAAGVIRYITGEAVSVTGTGEMLVVGGAAPDEAQRCETCFIPLEQRKSTFDEAEIGMAERDAITEALRCNRCGSCMACDVCLAVCDNRNAVLTLQETGESALAKVPFDLAAKALDAPEGWTMEVGGAKTATVLEPLLARVDEKLCIACGKCEEACPYKAVRTVFDTDVTQHASVELSACRGCGACAGACPTGAVTMGYMDDGDLFLVLRDAVRHSGENGGIVRISCMWHGPSKERRPWEVRVQCTRRVSPTMLVEALASGARAVSVVGCGQEECHYLPGPRMGPDVVDSARGILEAIGINPNRISYIDDRESLEEFFGGISGLGPFKPLAGKIPQTMSGLGRCLNAAQMLMAQPDEVRYTKAKTLLGYGCLAVSEPAFAAYGMQDRDILAAAEGLLEVAGIQYAGASGVHTSGAKLKDWGMDGLHGIYIGNISKTLKESGAETLIVPTPNCYETQSRMGLGCKVVSLPAALKDGLRGKFAGTDITVAYHPACSGSGEFDRDCLELLTLVPGLNVVRLEGRCGDSGWMDATAESGKVARALLRSAWEAGAETVVAGSPRCAAHLRSVTQGWDSAGTGVMDMYTFLAGMLGGEE